MKKIVCCFITAIILAGCFTLPVSAKQNNIDVAKDIISIAKAEKDVKDAACIVFAGTCGLALKCGDMYFQNDKNAMKSTIIEKVKRAYPDLTNILVKCDMDLYLKTKKIQDKMEAGTSIFSLRNDIASLLKLAEQRD